MKKMENTTMITTMMHFWEEKNLKHLTS